MDFSIPELAQGQTAYITRMRREFHKHPELSGRETWTRSVLIREIEDMGLPYELLPGTGIIAKIEGAKPGKTRVLRADIDGLPVQEESCNLAGEKACLSEVEGACHACGHDAHMAMLLASMRVLCGLKDQLEGNVLCCFEEGEETNCGIYKMLDGLAKYPVDEVFGLHVYAGLEAGKVNIEPGPRMAGAVGIGIIFKGRAGHGSRPDQALNPIIPAAHTVTQLNSAFENRLNVEETVTLGITTFLAGQTDTNNVFPDKAIVAGSCRYFNVEEGLKAFDLLCSTPKATAEVFGCSVEFEERHRVLLPPIINDPLVAQRIAASVAEHCGADLLGSCGRWYASDCYCRYLEKWPGALGLVGIRDEAFGSGAPHHNGRFDLDESRLWPGVAAELCFVLG